MKSCLIVIDAQESFRHHPSFTAPDGQTLPAAAIKMRTATVLAERFATLCSVDEALARPSH